MTITGKMVPLMVDNVDTDQIIPAEFLKQTSKEGYGKHLFRNWRYSSNGNENISFNLNKPRHYGSQLLMAGKNFGCGSSREHAVWALLDYGFKAVVSEAFADIFKGNAYNNGLLPIELNPESISELNARLGENAELIFHIDLEGQNIYCPEIGFSAWFPIDAFKKDCLLSGTDETGYLIAMQEEIRQFETERIKK